MVAGSAGLSTSVYQIVKLHIVSIVLDGMPFLPMQLATLNRLDTKLVDWHWQISEGAAANTGSTKWCQPQKPRFSYDGSAELLRSWLEHPRITIRGRQFWPDGKDEMFNSALTQITDPCILLQMDIDELWTAEQLETLVGFFNAYDQIKSAYFLCRYFLGPNIVITSLDTYGNRPGEWLRAFRYEPGTKFLSHEPPVMEGRIDPFATREQTQEVGLVFDHWAYVFEKQVAYKERFYGYRNAVAYWRRLQENTNWPVTDLQRFLPWVGPGVTADRLFK